MLFSESMVRCRVGNNTVKNGLLSSVTLFTSATITCFVKTVSILWVTFVFFPQWFTTMTVVSAVLTICWLVFCNSHTSNYPCIIWSLHFLPCHGDSYQDPVCVFY